MYLHIDSTLFADANLEQNDVEGVKEGGKQREGVAVEPQVGRRHRQRKHGCDRR